MLNCPSNILAEYLAEKEQFIDESVLFILGIPLAVNFENFYNSLSANDCYLNVINSHFLDNLSTLTNAYIEFNKNGEIRQLAESLDDDKSNIVIISDIILHDDCDNYTHDIPLYCLLSKKIIVENLISLNEQPHSNTINVSLKVDANNNYDVLFSHFMNSWDVFQNDCFNSNYLFFSLPFYTENLDCSKLIINALKRQSLFLNVSENGYKTLLAYKNKIIQKKESEIVDYYRKPIEISFQKNIRLKNLDMYRGQYADALAANINKLPMSVEKLILVLNDAKKQWIEILNLYKQEGTPSIKDFLSFLDLIIEKERIIANTFDKLFKL
jgi:hypothetical protein